MVLPQREALSIPLPTPAPQGPLRPRDPAGLGFAAARRGSWAGAVCTCSEAGCRAPLGCLQGLGKGGGGLQTSNATFLNSWKEPWAPALAPTWPLCSLWGLQQLLRLRGRGGRGVSLLPGVKPFLDCLPHFPQAFSVLCLYWSLPPTAPIHI